MLFLFMCAFLLFPVQIVASYNNVFSSDFRKTRLRNLHECHISYGHFKDPYQFPSEYLFVGGSIIVPCLCPKSTCNSSAANIKLGYKTLSSASDNFMQLGPEIARPVVTAKDIFQPFVGRGFVISLTQSFLESLKRDEDRRNLICTCDSVTDIARLALPAYRICTEKECQKNACQKKSTNNSAICSVSLRPVADSSPRCLERIRFKNETEASGCLDRDCDCPSLEQYSSFLDYFALCLDPKNGSYFRSGGVCRAHQSNLIDQLTWEVTYRFQLGDYATEASKKMLEIILHDVLGLTQHLSESCHHDIGSDLILGGSKVRLLQTYQLTGAKTLLLVRNPFVCSLKYPLKAYMCHRNCSVSERKLLDGSCETGWKISLNDFTQFRHQIYVTDLIELDLISVHQKLLSYKSLLNFTVKQMEELYSWLPHEEIASRFFVIPDKILMVKENVGNVTEAADITEVVCLTPYGNTGVVNGTCERNEIRWRSCYPKVQQFIINANPRSSIISEPINTNSEPINTNSTEKNEPLALWIYLLISFAAFLILLLMGLMAVFLFLWRRNKKKMRGWMAMYKLPKKAETLPGENSRLAKLKQAASSRRVLLSSSMDISGSQVEVEIKTGDPESLQGQTGRWNERRATETKTQSTYDVTSPTEESESAEHDEN